jgi:hypothetical protein
MRVRVDEAGVRLLGGVFLFVVFLSFAGGRVGGAGGGLLGAPFVPERLEFLHLGGLGGGEVHGFTDVGGEVVEFGLAAAALGDDEFQIGRGGGALRAVAPVKGLVRMRGLFAREVGQEIDAVESPGGIGY